MQRLKFIDATNLHGLASINLTNGPVKIFWIIVMVAMLGLGAYFTWRTIDRYQQQAIYSLTYTTTETEAKPLDTPDFVLCFWTADGVDLTLLPKEIQLDQNCPQIFEVEVKTQNSSRLTCTIEQDNKFKFHIWHITTKQFGVETKYRVCFRLAIPREYASTPGYETDKLIKFHIHYLPLLIDQNQSNQVDLLIMPRMETYVYRSNFVKFILDRRSYYEFQFQIPQYNELLPEDQGGTCVSQANEKLRYFYNYSMVNCLASCRINETIRKLGCLPQDVPAQIDRLELLRDVKNCTRSIEAFEFAPLSCSQKCKRACKFWSYELKVDDVNIDDAALDEMWAERHLRCQDKNTPRSLCHNISDIINFNQHTVPYKLQLAFRLLYGSKYKITEEKNVGDLADLVGSVGGICGLYLGASFVSAVGVMYYIFAESWRWMSKTLRRVRDKVKSKRPPQRVSITGGNPLTLQATK